MNILVVGLTQALLNVNLQCFPCGSLQSWVITLVRLIMVDPGLVDLLGFMRIHQGSWLRTKLLDSTNDLTHGIRSCMWKKPYDIYDRKELLLYFGLENPRAINVSSAF